ncbi:putative phage abortive infection protein [Sphingomonas bacterium]|uniref:putative phage abortive infection protein n=1 Tax=Sphingomonas bacterium TaxID=1895847 RepID=UPI002604FAB3|nr:putative phage abortive infection protein [Sphingomonas bacterium]
MRVRTVIFGFFGVVLFWAVYADYSLGLARYFTEDSSLNLQGAGTWGDSFGGFNAFVSTIGAIVVIATLTLQQRSIRYQAIDTHKQQFESSFFELMRLMREVRNELTFKHSIKYRSIRISRGAPTLSLRRTYRGLDAIAYALVEIFFWHKEAGELSSSTRERMQELYDSSVLSPNGDTFSAYFRIIYSVLYKIKNDKVLTEQEKFSYGNLIRSQLTARELYLLAYNSTHKVSKDLESLLVYFRIFKYMPDGKRRSRIEGNFDPDAFKERS